MEINDVLTDPCPQCALKHLSAALAYELGKNPNDEPLSGGPAIEVGAPLGVAYINYVEFLAGYASHLDYVVGMLVLAEEFQAVVGPVEPLHRIRKLRLALVEDPYSAETRGGFLDLRPHMDMAQAHIYEATREFPDFVSAIPPSSGGTAVDWILAGISWLRGEFFGSAQPARTGGDDDNGKGKTGVPRQEGRKARRQEGGPGRLQGRQG